MVLQNVDNSCWLDSMISIYLNCNLPLSNAHDSPNRFVPMFHKVLHERCLNSKLKLLRQLRNNDMEDFSEMLCKLFGDSVVVSTKLFHIGILVHKLPPESNAVLMTSTSPTCVKKLIQKLDSKIDIQPCALVVYRSYHYFTLFRVSSGVYVNHEDTYSRYSLREAILKFPLYGCVYRCC